MAFDLETRKPKLDNTTILPFLSFIMSGGSGSRLWPLSRLDKPKQFHRLAGKISMLSGTINRLKALESFSRKISVIGAQAHQQLIAEAIEEQQNASGCRDGVEMLLEPVARNTAAVAALATATALREYGDALILLCPADHEISTDQEFWQSVNQGIQAAQYGAIVTFGLLPERPETGYGYMEAGKPCGNGYLITRFVEKPDYETALSYIRQGNFFWNSGIFLFRASVMRDAFLAHAPAIWTTVCKALDYAETRGNATSLAVKHYQEAPAISFDCAIMEKVSNRVLIPASFRWSDLGSWQSLQQLHKNTADQANDGNVLVGNVVAHDCHNSYLRSEAGLLTVSGMRDMAVIATRDATFVAPLAHSHHVQSIVSRLQHEKRRELYYETSRSQADHSDNSDLVRNWLFEKAMPLWAKVGIDPRYGGFHEALTLQGVPVVAPRRSRTMARQIYAFAAAGNAGWQGAATGLVAHGLLFMQTHGRSRKGGWVQSFLADGTVVQEQENLYDQTCMLLALAHAYKSGHNQALPLAEETFCFLDRFLAHPQGGYYEAPADACNPQEKLTSNAHMHLLEACLAWHDVSGEERFLNRATDLVRHCICYFYDREYWSLGEFFTSNWCRVSGPQGIHTEPGHHYEWAALLCDYAQRTGDDTVRIIASRLYAFALSAGTNRTTGLAYNIVSRQGAPLETGSRSWQQCEAIKAAIMLDGYNNLNLKPEIEARVANLFRWHLHSAQEGLWIDRVDAAGARMSNDVPASILYHLVSALTCYLHFTNRKAEVSLLLGVPVSGVPLTA